MSAKITSLSDILFIPTQSNLNLQCSYVGEPIPKAKWFFNNHETGWLQQRTAYGQTNAYLEAVIRDKNNGNYTCYAENRLGTDSISYQVYVQGKFFYKNIVNFKRVKKLRFIWKIFLLIRWISDRNINKNKQAYYI